LTEKMRAVNFTASYMHEERAQKERGVIWSNSESGIVHHFSVLDKQQNFANVFLSRQTFGLAALMFSGFC